MIRQRFLSRAGSHRLVFLLASAAACGDSADSPQAPGGTIGTVVPTGTPGGAAPAAPVTSTPGAPVPMTTGVTGAPVSAPTVVGTTPPSTSPVSAAGNELWCKAKAVLDARCTACHDGMGTAATPMGLTRYADLTAVAPG